jgi:hypothetical protein
MALYIVDDIIEFLGQEYLGDNIWDQMCEYIINLCISKDCAIRHAASYGIGNFAKFTIKNFEKYSDQLIMALYKGLQFQKPNEDTEDSEKIENYYLAYDNLIAALGKIFNYQYNNMPNKHDIIKNWIMGLPIKYDETEQEEQHLWMCDLFLKFKELIPRECYGHYFESLAIVYDTKKSNETNDKKIKEIYSNYVLNNDEVKKIIEEIYQKSSNKVKIQFEKLIKN